jgi:PTH1 family peptidyl-tRNA hydrolase
MRWLVVGLGNPGERYADTRHNIGVTVVEELAHRAGARLRKVRFLPVLCAETTDGGEKVLLARSLRFMNDSGPVFASLAKRRGLDAEHVIACHDDIDLPFGSLRVKFGGSTAGHHGLNSLVAALRTPDFHRVRLGVGRPPGRVETHPDWLLDRFTERERPEAAALVSDGADAVRSLIRDGLAATQDRFNRRGAGST